MLGPVEVRRDGVRVDVGGPRPRGVLARLLLARGAVVPADRILDDVWGDAAPVDAHQVLQVQVSRLRRALEPQRRARAEATVLLSRPPGYALAARSDADAFAELVDVGSARLAAGDTAGAAKVLDEALGLWSGATPYADLADEPWLQAEIARLQELHLVAREQRLAVAVDGADVARAIPALEALVAEHPLREGPTRLLALALYRTARQADALAALRRIRRRLADELGVEPGPALRRTEEQVLNQAAELDAPVPVAVPQALLLGRDRELAAIAAAAAAPGPAVVVLRGEPGIGKTRIAEVAIARAAERTAVWGRCHESSGAPALWPWIQVLESLAVDHPLPAELARIVAGAPAPEVADAAAARFRQHHAVARHLAAIAALRPLAIVLDDLQWADRESLALLADLPALARDAPILLVATVRSGEEPPGLADALVRLAHHGTVPLTVDGLPAEAVAALVAESGRDLDPIELARRTGGNPFLVRETLRARDGVPPGAAALLRGRVARLPAAAQEVLQVAAVAGRRLDVAVLAAAAQRPEAEVREALDAAATAGLLAPDGVAFAHDLVRESVRSDIPPMRRALLHARIVEVLAARTPADVSALAAHAVAADDPATALRWTRAAAEEAVGRLAFDDAVRWWRAALAAHARVVAGTPGERVDLLLALLRAQLDSGDIVGAGETRMDAIAASDAAADPQRAFAALVALDLPSIWVLRHYDQADLDVVARLEAALAVPGVDDRMRARLLATLANELAYVADPNRTAIADEALALARGLADPRLLAFCLVARYLAVSASSMGAQLHGQVREIGEELLALDADGRLPSLGLVGHLVMMVAGLQDFDVQAAEAHAARAKRLIDRLHQPVLAAQYLSWQGNRRLLSGDVAGTEEVLAQFVALTLEWWALRPLCTVVQLFILLQGDRMAEAGPLLDTVGDVHAAIAHDAELLSLVARGETDRAVRQSIGRSWPPIPADWLGPVAACMRAAAAAVVGDTAVRQAAYDALAPAGGHVVSNGSIDGGPADHHLGALAVALGEPDVAATHYRRLERRAQDAGLTWWAWQARAHLAALGAGAAGSGA